jgi:hypothetical protein
MRYVTDAEAVEMLLRVFFEGSASDVPWVRHWGIEAEMEELAYHKELDMLVPYQYLLLTLAGDATREATRETAQAVRDAAEKLLALLDLYDHARQGEHPEWAKLIALLEAPFPVRRPHNCDTRDPDVISVMVRDIRFGGSWKKKLRWLALQGTQAQQRVDGARARRLAAFEEAYGVDLADLLFSDEARAEHEKLAEEVEEGVHRLRPLRWREN